MSTKTGIQIGRRARNDPSFNCFISTRKYFITGLRKLLHELRGAAPKKAFASKLKIPLRTLTDIEKLSAVSEPNWHILKQNLGNDFKEFGALCPEGWGAHSISSKPSEGIPEGLPNRRIEEAPAAILDPAGVGTKTFRVRSHKFIPVYCTASQFRHLWSHGAALSVDCEWLGPYRMLRCKRTDISVSLFPFGTLMVHIPEELDFDSIASLALWRRRSYSHILDNESRYLASVFGELPQTKAKKGKNSPTWESMRAPYVFSMYNVLLPAWGGTAAIEVGIALLSEPSILIPQSEQPLCANDSEDHLRARAQQAEMDIFKTGLSYQGISRFGLTDISIGCASWAGVSYYAVSKDRALSEARMVSFEIAVQALWSYCDLIPSLVQRYGARAVAQDYGMRYLHLCLSRVTSPAPREQSQMCLMREAIVETSRLRTKLEQAIRSLEELS